jgi:hypothetical protein
MPEHSTEIASTQAKRGQHAVHSAKTLSRPKGVADRDTVRDARAVVGCDDTVGRAAPGDDGRRAVAHGDGHVGGRRESVGVARLLLARFVSVTDEAMVAVLATLPVAAGSMVVVESAWELDA